MPNAIITTIVLGLLSVQAPVGPTHAHAPTRAVRDFASEISAFEPTPIVDAQGTSRAIERSLVLVAVDSLKSRKVVAVVRRSAGPSGRDLILVRRNHSDAEDVLYALRALIASRRRHGATPTRGLEFSLTARQHRAPYTPAQRAWAERTLKQLRQAEPIEVRGMGRFPTVNIQLEDVPGMGG
jgi:hypothetical protein